MSERHRSCEGDAHEAGRVRPSRLTARRLVFAAVAAVVLGILVTGATFYQHGYRVWVVHTGSMEPTLMPGDVVIDAPPQDGYEAGDVITFLHSALASDVVTHRITDVTRAGLIHTKGDANGSADVWDIRPGQVQGRVIHTIKGLGYLLVFLRQPTGIAAAVALLTTIVLLWQLFFAPERAEPSAAASSETTPDGLVAV